jgi:hypothetical protein
MKKIISGVLYYFNRLNPVALIVVVLSIFYISFKLYFNEEIYFGFSKAYMDPDWIPGSTLFTDFAGNRIFFQVIFGWVLKYISFENFAFFGRLLGYIFLAFPLAAIAKHLKINNVVLVFWLTVFFVPQQSFFAGEWIFGGFETKIFAYFFVFYSIWFLFKERFLPAVIFAILAIYWHMLVGGWYTLYLFIYLFITMGLNRKFILYWFYAGLILLPFIVYIWSGLISGSQNIINGVNTGYLYAYVRNPHHIGILKSWDYFSHRHLGKVLMAFVAFCLALTIYRKQIPSRFKMINTFLIIILAQNLIFLFVALFDKNGFVAKFYPWRGSSLAMFFFQVATIVLIRYNWMPRLYEILLGKYKALHGRLFYLLQMGLFLVITLTILAFTISGRIEKARINQPSWDEVDKVSEKLKEVSQTGDMFMFLGEESLYNISLSRKAARDVYYWFRFSPSQSQAIYKWYCRGQEQEKVKNDPKYLVTSGLDKKISFIVSSGDLNEDFLELMYKSDNYRVYKVIH